MTTAFRHEICVRKTREGLMENTEKNDDRLYGLSNIKEIYKYDTKSPVALSFLNALGSTIALWFGASLIVALAFKNFIYFLKKHELIYGTFCLVGVGTLVQYLHHMGSRLYTNYISLVSGMLVSWYPSKFRKLGIWYFLGALGFSMPILSWAYSIYSKFTWPFSMQSSVWQTLIFFIQCQGFILGGISTAARSSRLRMMNKTKFANSPELLNLDISDLNSRSDGIIVSHLSDLHLTGGALTLEGQKSPDSIFSNLIDKHRKELNRSDAIIISGDITDTGSAVEWTAFFERYPIDLIDKTALIPGNHDINIAGRNPLQVNDPEHIGRSIRMVRMLIAMRFVQGDRSYIVDKSGNVRRLSDYLDEQLPEFIDFLYTTHRLKQSLNSLAGTFPNFAKLMDDNNNLPMRILSFWSQIFPMGIILPQNIVLYVFDSNKLSHFIGDNAFGQLGGPEKKEPLNRLLALRNKKFKNHSSLFAIHHHLVLPLSPNTYIKRIMVKAMVLLDAPTVFEFLQQFTPTVVFHGHRHVRYECTIEDKIDVVSAPSTTLGDEYHGTEPAIMQYRILSNTDDLNRSKKKKKTDRRFGTRLGGMAKLSL